MPVGAVLVAAVALLAIAATSASARGGAPYPPDGENPFRIAYVFAAPVGTLLEWTVTRPIAAIGREVAPYGHIDEKSFKGCSRERPARSCTKVVK